MKINTSLVAFIDILGFKNIVHDSLRNSNYNTLKELQNALRQAEEYAIKYTNIYLKDFKIKLKFKQFSDCVTISLDIKAISDEYYILLIATFINTVRLYHFILLDNKVIARGGISLGQHFEKNNFIFSEALISAYDIESNKSIYPRIVIDNKLLDKLKSLLKERNQTEFMEYYELFLNSFIEDWDRQIFVSSIGVLNMLIFLNRKFGQDFLVDIYKNFFEESDIKEIISKLDSNDLEKQKIENIKNNLFDIIKENNLNHNINTKYYWLVEFINWNEDKNSSKIKFSRYFENYY